ncbi:MAG: hypothetical protein N3D20_02805 [Candidatus Pacearchaeota archaeon]|nr:hypothetical protein [Candidatus Pacearchaeota archaeon]
MPRIKKINLENVPAPTDNTENTEKEQSVTEEVKEERKFVRYPKIIGGVCEFCGISVRECEHYKNLFNSGKFRCACGASNNPSTFGQSIYIHTDKIGFICNSEGCKRIAASSGLFTDERVFRFFNP